MPTSHKKVIKNRTHGGDLCHTYFELVNDDIAYLIIIRYTLSKDYRIHNKFSVFLRMYKGYGVYRQMIVLKTDTLNEINNWIETLTK